MKNLIYIEYNENLIDEEDAVRIDGLIGQIINKKEPHIRAQADLGGINIWVR